MYIYLDETFNLKKGSKKQFLAIAGYSTEKPKDLTKMFARIKRSKLPKRFAISEIKSTDLLANKFIKPYLFNNLCQSDISIYCNIQFKNTLPNIYFSKTRLDYDQFYLDLLADLLIKRWDYLDQKIVILALDTFKTKKINKQKIIDNLKNSLREKFPSKKFEILFESSASSLNLQIADLICGIFYDQVFRDSKWIKSLKSKITKTTVNPLN